MPRLRWPLDRCRDTSASPGCAGRIPHGDLHLPAQAGFVLTGAGGGTDEQMVELLALSPGSVTWRHASSCSAPDSPTSEPNARRPPASPTCKTPRCDAVDGPLPPGDDVADGRRP